MRRIFTVVVIAIVCWAHAAAPGNPTALFQVKLTSEQIGRLEGIVKSAMDENRVVGLQVAVGLGGEVVWTSGFGMADLEHPSPVTPETLFRTASISKWLTATAAMRLVELGKIDLDAPIQRYCPEYPEKQWKVTTHHLLQHRAGIRQYWGGNGEPRDTAEQRDLIQQRSDEERLWMSVRYTDVLGPLQRFKDDPLLFEPGMRYHYTSLGYRVLGCVLQGAAGKSYGELMRELVLQPAGMSHTRDDDAIAVIPRRARGYTRTPSGELRRSRFRDVSENLPAGGHLSTAADLVRFALAFHQDKLVTSESRRRMTAAPPGVEPTDSYYGYGIDVVKMKEVAGGVVMMHGGGQDETRTLLSLNPESGIAMATMTNFEPYHPGHQQQLQLRLAEVLLGTGAGTAASPVKK